MKKLYLAGLFLLLFSAEHLAAEKSNLVPPPDMMKNGGEEKEDKSLILGLAQTNSQSICLTATTSWHFNTLGYKVDTEEKETENGYSVKVTGFTGPKPGSIVMPAMGPAQKQIQLPFAMEKLDGKTVEVAHDGENIKLTFKVKDNLLTVNQEGGKEKLRFEGETWALVPANAISIRVSHYFRGDAKDSMAHYQKLEKDKEYQATVQKEVDDCLSLCAADLKAELLVISEEAPVLNTNFASIGVKFPNMASGFYTCDVTEKDAMAVFEKLAGKNVYVALYDAKTGKTWDNNTKAK